jgi:transposase InsO family protein
LSDHYLTDVDLAAEIYDIHVASRRTYGAPRVAGQLANRGRRHSRKRVARIMAECGLVGVHGRKKWRRGKANPAPAPDLLQRDFTAEASNQRWVADITEFRCWDGKLYLAGIFDLHDHAIVGWSMAQRQTTDLVVNALVMATHIAEANLQTAFGHRLRESPRESAREKFDRSTSEHGERTTNHRLHPVRPV